MADKKPDIAEILSRALGVGDNDEVDESNYSGDPSLDAEILRGWYSAWEHRDEFKPGDIVRAKRGLNMWAHPKLNQPGVVLEVRDDAEPRFRGDTGQPYYGLRDSLLVGVRLRGRFLTFWFDKRFFELYPEDELPGLQSSK